MNKHLWENTDAFYLHGREVFNEDETLIKIRIKINFTLLI